MPYENCWFLHFFRLNTKSVAQFSWNLICINDSIKISHYTERQSVVHSKIVLGQYQHIDICQLCRVRGPTTSHYYFRNSNNTNLPTVQIRNSRSTYSEPFEFISEQIQLEIQWFFPLYISSRSRTLKFFFHRGSSRRELFKSFCNAAKHSYCWWSMYSCLCSVDRDWNSLSVSAAHRHHLAPAAA